MAGAGVTDRVDPYWGGMWAVGSNAVWLSRRNAERMSAAGLGSPRAAEVRLSVEQATAALVDGYRGGVRLAALAAVGMWRTLNVGQLASIVGDSRLARPRCADRDVLWASGLTQRGRYLTGFGRDHVPELVRVSNTTDFDGLAARLSYRQWVGVTGGQPWRFGGQFDRHNLIAAEVALRVAELTDAALVMGEQMASISLLAAGLTRVPPRTTRSADAVVVRSDGLRIAVEVTATVTSDFRKKIARWAELLTSDTHRGLAVVFVEASHPDLAAKNVGTHLAQAVHDASHASMDAVIAKVPERMMVVRYADWFPGPGLVARDFAGLPATRPVGPAGQRWRPVNMLDPFDLVYSRPAPDAGAVLSNASLLYGVPHWMRTGSCPQLGPVVRSWAGVSEEPKRPYSRPDLLAKRAAS